MNNKIKEVRLALELTEPEVSSLLNISSYKYKRFESNLFDIDTESLLLLSVAYGISMDYLISDLYTIEDIFRLQSMTELCKIKEKVLEKIDLNLCKAYNMNIEKSSYRTRRILVKKATIVFSKNLSKNRRENKMTVAEVAKRIGTDEKSYLCFENAKSVPIPMQLLLLSEIFKVTIQDFFI